MRRDVDRESLAGVRTDAEPPFGRRRRRQAERGSIRAEERRDRGEVVRRDIEHRPAARLVEDVRIRMPVVRPADEERRSRSEWRSDLALRDQLARGLVRAAKEGIGRTADAQPAAVGLGQKVTAFRHGRRDRLLGVHVLAGFEGGSNHRCVSGRRREVQHDVDRRVHDQIVDARRLQAVHLRERVCAIGVEVSAGDDVE